MRLTISSLLALYIAVPSTMVQALDLQVAVVSTLVTGTMTVSPGGSPVELHHLEGENPMIVGSLPLTGIGPDNFGRFDLIDNSVAPNYYTQVSRDIVH